jgi:hypothetical protein
MTSAAYIKYFKMQQPKQTCIIPKQQQHRIMECGGQICSNRRIAGSVTQKKLIQAIGTRSRSLHVREIEDPWID